MKTVLGPECRLRSILDELMDTSFIPSKKPKTDEIMVSGYHWYTFFVQVFVRRAFQNSHYLMKY